MNWKPSPIKLEGRISKFSGIKTSKNGNPYMSFSLVRPTPVYDKKTKETTYKPSSFRVVCFDSTIMDSCMELVIDDNQVIVECDFSKTTKKLDSGEWTNEINLYMKGIESTEGLPEAIKKEYVEKKLETNQEFTSDDIPF